MANDKKFQVKNGLRTQNINFQSDPDATNLITTSMIDDLDTLSISGDAGQLFSLSDDLTGSVFTVNDISGMPSIEVLASGNILLAEYEGNVGIGTTSPVAKLHIENGDMRIEKDTKATIGFRGHTAGSTALAFRDTNAGVDRMTIDASGNVSIGSSNSLGVLTIRATVSDDQDIITITENGTNQSFSINGNLAGSGSTGNSITLDSFWTDDIIVFRGDGNVGFGTTSPDTLAHLAAGAGSAVLRLENTDAFLSDGEVVGKIEFETQDEGGAGVNAYIQAAGVSTEGATRLEFGTGGSGSPSTRMTINSNGNVGIGTISPSRELEVIGAGNVYIRVTAEGATDAAGLELNNAGLIWLIQNDDTSSDALTFDRAGVEAMRIESSGNVGIGTNSVNANSQLHISNAGAAQLRIEDTTSAGTCAINFSDADDGNVGQILYSHADNSLAIKTNDSERMLISSVGTTTIKTDGTTQLVLNRADASIANGNQVANLLVTGDDPSAGQSGAAINFTAGAAWSTDSYPTNIAFYNDSAGTLAPRMTIASGGNVGIGVDNPDSLLHLKNTDADVRLTLETGESYDCYINFSGATSEASVGYDATSNHLVFCNPAGDLTTGQVMRIDANGNILVNTSTIPTGLGSSNTKLILSDVEDAPEFVAYNNDNGLVLGDKIGAYLFGNDDNNATEDHFAGMWATSASTTGIMDIHFAGGKTNYENDDPHMTLTSLGNILLQNGSPEFHFGTASALHYNWRIAAQEEVDKGFEIASGTTSLGSGALVDTYTTRLAILGDNGHVGLGISDPVATIHAQPTRTGVNYATVFAGGTSANSGQHGISLMTGGNALGGLLGSNLTLDDLTFAQSNTARSSGYVGFENTTTASQKSKITFGGINLGTTTAVNTMELDGFGNLAVLGNITAYATLSDISLKENIEVIPNAVDKVKTLDGITFNYIKDGPDKRMTGVIAQQVQEVLPEAVYETEMIGDNENKNLAVRYGNMVGLLIEAIKEQQQQIDELKEIIFRGEIS